MDNQTSKPVSQQGIPVGTIVEPSSPAASTLQQADVANAPIDAVSSGNKEHAPVSTDGVDVVLKPTEVPPILHPEVKAIGVEQTPNHTQQVQLTPAQVAVGITPAASATPAPTQLSGNLVLPMTEAKAEEIKKSKLPITEAVRWLAELVIEQVKKAHQQIMSG